MVVLGKRRWAHLLCIYSIVYNNQSYNMSQWKRTYAYFWRILQQLAARASACVSRLQLVLAWERSSLVRRCCRRTLRRVLPSCARMEDAAQCKGRPYQLNTPRGPTPTGMSDPSRVREAIAWTIRGMVSNAGRVQSLFLAGIERRNKNEPHPCRACSRPGDLLPNRSSGFSTDVNFLPPGKL